MKTKIKRSCKCGCGRIVKLGNNYINGHNAGMKGRNQSEETKKKISLSETGKVVSKETKKKMSLSAMGNTKCLGYKHSDKTRQRMSMANIGKILSEKTKQKIAISMIGCHNHHYNPNLTNEERINGRNIPGYNEWLMAVFKRDNYICKICGQIGGKLNAHHMESYHDNPKLRTTLLNGITICESCHKDFHHQYGYGNNTEKQWKKFIKRGDNIYA